MGWSSRCRRNPQSTSTRPIYGLNGIPEVWVLRPTSGTAWELLRCTEPAADGYRSTATIALPDGPASIPAEL
jgi:hypothetical protein